MNSEKLINDVRTVYHSGIRPITRDFGSKSSGCGCALGAAAITCGFETYWNNGNDVLHMYGLSIYDAMGVTYGFDGTPMSDMCSPEGYRVGQLLRSEFQPKDPYP